jgi:signal transduction histidine kinase
MASPRYLELVAQAHNPILDDIIGRSWQEVTLLSPEEDPMGHWKMVVEGRTPFRIPELVASFVPDKPETVWDYDLTPIMDTEEPNRVCYVLVSAVEITDQVHVRKDLERLEELRDDFLSLATHELRSPLTSIQGNAQLLQRTLKRHVASLGEKQAQEQHLDQSLTQVDNVLRQLRSMNSLIAEMFDVARLRGEGFELRLQENVDLVALVRRVVEQHKMQSHSISVQSSEKIIPVTLDEDRIEQVLNNLLSNAIKYSPSETTIEVPLERRQGSTEVTVAVRDEGNGIREEDQAHIFERFYRVRTGENGHVDGLGLGLYIAYSIVKCHGGRMWLTSQPGKGSTFFFTLPL